jgi:hypothetical protein
MRVSIADITRINTCGILNKNKWDYASEKIGSPSYDIGMKEILRWHYRRGKPIDQESFITFLFNLNAKLNLSHEEKIILETAFRNFIASEFYVNMKHVYMNYQTDIKINNFDVLENIIPYFLNNPSKPTFIYLNSHLEQKELFLQRYEVMHNAVWCFYNLGKSASYLRFWFDGKEIRKDIIKIDDKYVARAKKNLITLGQNLNMFVMPPIQTCKACSMISLCERFIEKPSKKRGKNVTTTTS